MIQNKIAVLEMPKNIDFEGAVSWLSKDMVQKVVARARASCDAEGVPLPWEA